MGTALVRTGILTVALGAAGMGLAPAAHATERAFFDISYSYSAHAGIIPN